MSQQKSMHHIQHQSEHTGGCGIVYYFSDRKENPTKTFQEDLLTVTMIEKKKL